MSLENPETLKTIPFTLTPTRPISLQVAVVSDSDSGDRPAWATSPFMLRHPGSIMSKPNSVRAWNPVTPASQHPESMAAVDTSDSFLDELRRDSLEALFDSLGGNSFQDSPPFRMLTPSRPFSSQPRTESLVESETVRLGKLTEQSCLNDALSATGSNDPRFRHQNAENEGNPLVMLASSQPFYQKSNSTWPHFTLTPSKPLSLQSYPSPLSSPSAKNCSVDQTGVQTAFSKRYAPLSFSGYPSTVETDLYSLVKNNASGNQRTPLNEKEKPNSR